MNPSDPRRFIEALRRGDKKAIAEFLKLRALETRIVCQHCGESVLPRVISYDFTQLAVNAECPLCGKTNRLPIQDWNAPPPLQPPPTS